MPVINILSPHVADMIAAGEVVERPASVVKELMENAFDAGARNISVEIRGGGATYIRVTDDGCGMAPEDAGVAFLRHATSKLRDEHGLESINTMGFRGEALAAISSVSRITLITRKKGEETGTKLSLDAGDIQDMLPTGCPEGTSIIVKDLFFNTPARLKFLKSDRSESGACVQAALRCALGRPEVSVRFIKDGKEEFFSPGDGRQDSCIYSLLGRELAASLLSCESSGEGLSMSGFVSSPSAGRGNRSAQYFFCNGRYIKSPMLQTAVEQAYRNTLLTGRFPACVIYLDVSCASVDVNVHPAKTEVKFSAEKKIFDLVYQAVRFTLENENRTAQVELSPATKKLAQPKADFYQSMSSEDFRNNGYAAKAPGGRAPAPVYESRSLFSSGASFGGSEPRNCVKQKNNFPEKSPGVFNNGPRDYASKVPSAPLSSTFRSFSTAYESGAKSHEMPEKPVFQPVNEEIIEKQQFPTAQFPQAVENSVQSVENSKVPDHKIVGEALKTYIIVEVDDQLILIDKHAAHERMIFDRLKTKKHQVMSQTLLTPVTVKLRGEDGENVEKNSQLLSELGFEIEPFGENDYIIRALPYDMDAADAAAAVEEICEKLRRGTAPDGESARDEILHTVACKAAIKAGWDTTEEELDAIACAVLSGEVKYCPHGRPVSIVVSHRDLDRMFKRIV